MQKIIIASGPVIIEDNKVLLDISGEDDFWKFCGGRVREDETLMQTAMRRANEELGINIEITDNEPLLLYTKKKKDNDTSDVILVHFLAKRIGEIAPGEDILEWKWIPLEELPNENLAPNIIPTLKHFRFIK